MFKSRLCAMDRIISIAVLADVLLADHAVSGLFYGIP